MAAAGRAGGVVVPAVVVPGGVVPGGVVPGGVEVCPVCGEPRPGPQARFCDNCRYDFVALLPFAAAPPRGPVPATAAPVVASEPVPAPDLVAAGLGAVQRWEVLAQVDPSLRKPEDPEPPDRNERLFALDMQDHLIGRRSDSADIHPEIVIPDPGISRRHARLIRRADGGVVLVDLGSMNGTKLNGAAVEANVVTPLAEGDQVTVGCWTRIILRAR